MSKFRKRKKSLGFFLAAATTGVVHSPALLAQEGNLVQEITVTGSRIRQTDGMAAPTPVTVMTPEELDSFDPGGTVSEQLDALPQFFGGTQTAQRNIGSLASGVGSFLNMRSLGSQRTLVLLDGARMAPGDKRGSVNVDTLPTALVRSIDVVTGGASAAYGADALGGVTNFVIDRQFQGFEVDVGTGIMEDGDGFRYNASVAGGFEIGDRLNVIASFETLQIDQIDLAPADLDGGWYRRWGFVTNPDPNGPEHLTVPDVAPTDRHVYGMISGAPAALNGMVFNREGTAVQPFQEGQFTTYARGTERTTSGGPEADLAYLANSGFPVNGQEVVGRTLFAAANYQFTDRLSGYVQALVGRSESNHVNLRASTTGISLRSIWAPRIAVDNAYLPDSVRQIMIDNGDNEFILSRDGAIPGVRDIGSNLSDPNTFKTSTYTIGFDYDLGNNWSIGGSYSTGETDRESFSLEHDRVDRMFLAMDAVVHPDTGEIVCRVNLPQYSPTEADLIAAGLASGRVNSRTEADPVPEPLKSPIGLDGTVSGCVPFNVFGHGNISEEAIDYIGTPKYGVGIVEQDFFEILATGDVFDGWGFGPVSGAFGLTWRESSFFDNALPIEVDELGPPLNVPALGIRGIPPGYTGGSPNLHKFSTVPKVGGQYDVWEWFGEFNAPIWESDSGVQRLGGAIAFRQSDYSTSGKADAWKAGLDFQISRGVRLRATRSRDVREANFRERFDAQGGGGNIDDPFQNGRTYTITTVASGNPNVAPEEADTTVVGFVFEPQFAALDGLQFSLDWYEVDISGAISQIGHQDVVDRCFAGVVEQCANIEFDPVTNDVTRVFRRFFNQDRAIVEGLDFEVIYRRDLDLFDSQSESFSVRALAGKLLTRQDISRAGVVTELLDQYNLPEITGNITANYNVGRWSFQMQGRFVDGGPLNDDWVEGIDVDDNTVPSSSWWNATVRYSNELANGRAWNIGLNILNLFDKHPPIIPGNLGAQIVSSTYDTYGRRYNLSVHFDF